MSDNLTVFSTNYTGVTGIKAKGTGNGMLTYIRPTGTKSITENGTSIDVTNYANVDVAVDNNFAIELTYNSQTGVWEPDCTFNEAKNAFINNKNIVSSINYPGIHSSFDGYNELDDQIYYSTEEYDTQNYARIGRSYIWRSTGQITEDIAETLYDTTTATAIASDVANGKLFFNANGRQVGTASGGGGDSYTRTVVVPQQTVTPDSNRQFEFTYSSSFVDGEYYVVTLDGVEWLTTSETIWENEVVIGDASVPWNTSDTVYPFVMSSGVGYSTNTNQHTLKVEHLEFVDGPLTIIPKSITQNGTYSASIDNADGYSSVTVNVPSIGGTYQAKTNISPTTSSQTITPDSGYDALSSVQINAMPTGTAGTPSATKGSVSNHSVSVTPSVTNTTGYITGGTKTGTAVSVSASELVSGTLSITSSGTKDVTNYASASVAAGGATASATKGSVSNHSVTVTPSVTRTAGYVTAGTVNGTAITVSASELVSGSETKTANGTYDVTNLASIVVAIPIVTYHTSSSAPTSSQGSDGDLWLVTA